MFFCCLGKWKTVTGNTQKIVYILVILFYFYKIGVIIKQYNGIIVSDG